MKKLSFLFLLASVLLFTQCTKDDASLEPTPPKPYSKPLIVDYVSSSGQVYNRTIYTYNSKGLETGIKSGSFERKNYKYEEKKLSYSDVVYGYNGEDISYQTERVTYFGDTQYTRPLKIEQITTYQDGKRERGVYTYNAYGSEISCKRYKNDVLDSERINYKYEGQKSSFTEVWYTENGEKTRLMNCTATYEDTEYKRPLVVELVYSSPYDDFKSSERTIYTYNAQGLVTNTKNYSGEMLMREHKDYTYGDKKSSYTEAFGDGLSALNATINTTYLY